jgi:CRP-like cAMP-binding protein
MLARIETHRTEKMNAVPTATIPGQALRSRTFFKSAAITGVPMRFEAKSEIYGEGEPAEYIYRVVAGTVRASKVLTDGRRQINAFYLPGDIFGLEIGEEHSFSAEAMSEATVLVIKRSVVAGEAQRNHEVARELWEATAHELHRVQDHVLLLIKSAQERVAAFLLEMAKRMPSKSGIDLPMSRQDIADYLGLTIETVSRTLTQLEKTAAIALPQSRHIVVRNHQALARLNS